MYQQQRYRANIVNAFLATQSMYLGLILLATGLATITLISSFRYYQQRTAMTYIFHPQGAALQIYDTGQVRSLSPTKSSTP